MSSGWISHGACVSPEFHYDFCIPPTPNSLSILWFDGLVVWVCVYPLPFLATTHFPLIVPTPKASWRCVHVVTSRILLSYSVPRKYWALMTLTGHLFYRPYRIDHRLRFVAVNAYVYMYIYIYIFQAIFWALSVFIFMMAMPLNGKVKLLNFYRAIEIKSYKIFGLFRIRLLRPQNSSVLKWPEISTGKSTGRTEAI